MTDHTPFEKLGRDVISLEADTLAALVARVNDQFALACRIIQACKGRVVVTGMGKSGHIGGKVAATLASTGTPAFFVHPGEASHGDIGMITVDDVVLAISNSGETEEILTILPIIKRMGVKLVALTGKTDSTIARQADAVLDCAVEQEACPLNLAPTASTTAALVMGDALAVALLKARGFTQEDFARSHPAGKLGRRLLLYVSDVMHTGSEIPVVKDDATLREALLEMTSKGLGMTGVVDERNRLLGVFTDGDLRRVLSREIDIRAAKITEIMTRNPRTEAADRLAAEAVNFMRTQKINGIFVVDAGGCVLGALNMHDLLRAGVM
ncbi:MAG TPA: KpsF/GutQ family sugar-phosphate isomerase [Burkholderiales bacterium]|nr:KpsF/GutQ family sugar-phosphate isomerase [Burkholderiales bacterium]